LNLLFPCAEADTVGFKKISVLYLPSALLLLSYLEEKDDHTSAVRTLNSIWVLDVVIIVVIKKKNGLSLEKNRGVLMVYDFHILSEQVKREPHVTVTATNSNWNEWWNSDDKKATRRTVTKSSNKKSM